MSKQVKNAHNLYIHAIQDGRVAEAQAQSVGDTYIQHSTGVPDGKEGFAAFFANFFERHPEREMKIVRTLFERADTTMWLVAGPAVPP